MPSNNIQENTRWEQAIEAMVARGVLDLTLDEFLAVIEATVTGEWKSISGGENYRPGMWERSLPLSPTQAARLFVVRHMMAEHSALQSWMETVDFVSSLTVRLTLMTSTAGQSIALAAWGRLSQLVLLDELRSDETDPLLTE